MSEAWFRPQLGQRRLEGRRRPAGDPPLGQPARRLAQGQGDDQRHHEAWSAKREECGLPAPLRRHPAAQGLPEQESEGRAQESDPQDRAPAIGLEVVGRQ